MVNVISKNSRAGRGDLDLVIGRGRKVSRWNQGIFGAWGSPSLWRLGALKLLGRLQHDRSVRKHPPATSMQRGGSSRNREEAHLKSLMRVKYSSIGCFAIYIRILWAVEALELDIEDTGVSVMWFEWREEVEAAVKTELWFKRMSVVFISVYFPLLIIMQAICCLIFIVLEHGTLFPRNPSTETPNYQHQWSQPKGDTFLYSWVLWDGDEKSYRLPIILLCSC